MARDGSRTRERIIRAAERVFARQGVDEANLRDINRLAGQANNSALHYHFGSRTALAQVVIDRHRTVIAAARAELVSALRIADPGPSVVDLVAAIVTPLAGRLGTESGRDYLRIILHIRGRGELRERGPASDPLGADLHWIYTRLHESLDWLPGSLRNERLAAMGDMVLAALAARADIDDAESDVDLDTFVTNLVDMAVAAIETPSRLVII